MSFVLVQHRSPDYKSQLAEIIGLATEMRVHEEQNGMKKAPNTVYFIPSDATLTLARRMLSVHKPAPTAASQTN